MAAYEMPISSTPPKIAMPSFPGDFCIFESRTVVAAVAIDSFKLTGIGPSHRPAGRNYTQKLLRECEKWLGIKMKSLRLLLGEGPKFTMSIFSDLSKFLAPHWHPNLRLGLLLGAFLSRTCTDS